MKRPLQELIEACLHSRNYKYPGLCRTSNRLEILSNEIAEEATARMGAASLGVRMTRYTNRDFHKSRLIDTVAASIDDRMAITYGPGW